MLLVRCFTLFILSFISVRASGQFFSQDQNPLSVKWREIEAAGFRIIYPSELEAEAQRMANTLTHIYPAVGATLGRQKTHIPILLQNRGVIPNGFVQLAPKKSEFYTTPPQVFDSQDWLNNLAVHELRHVAQFDKITGGKRKPFPEEIYLAYLGAAFPLWYFEGDAVSTETSLTTSGRGRQPAWIMPYRSLLLSGKDLTYSEAYFGSDKHISIGYYQLGYLLASSIREKHGHGIFDSVLTDIRRRPLRLYPFASSLKKYTGKTGRQWFITVQQDIKAAWLKQDEQVIYKKYPHLNVQPNYETNHFMPVRLPEGEILNLKITKSHTSKLVLTYRDTTRRDHTLTRIGYQNEPWFNYAAGKIVWDEVHADIRYKQRSYNVLCLYDLRKRERYQVTTRTRLFSPALSPDGNKIIAVSADLSNRFTLTEMDSGNGNILRTIPNPEGFILQMPSYSADGKQITYLSVSEKGKSLWKMDLESGKKVLLIPNSKQQLSRPVFVQRSIVFNAHLNGIDNVYALDTASLKINALTASKTGAFNASENNGLMLFNEFTPNGYTIAETEITPSEAGANTFVYFGKAAEEQEKRGNIFENVPREEFTSKKYAALSGVFNFHSLSPGFDANENAGIRLNSSNLLNTVAVSAGVYYHSSLQRPEYHASLDFKALFPVFSLNYRNRPRDFEVFNGLGFDRITWRENYYSFHAALPLSLSSFNENFSAELSAGTSYTQRYGYGNFPLLKEIKFPMEYRISLSHSIRRAERDLVPRWAQSFSFGYFHLPFQRTTEGSLYAFSSNLYFPGIMRNHSFTVGANYQVGKGVYRFNNEVPTVYGDDRIVSFSGVKNTLLFNYRFPISYPGEEFGSLAYVRNLRGGLFIHYEDLTEATTLDNPKTFGFELRSSMNLLRYLPVADLGIRMIFVNKTYHQNPVVEFIFNIDL